MSLRQEGYIYFSFIIIYNSEKPCGSSPSPAHCSGPSRFQGEFVAIEPRKRPSTEG